MDANSAGNDLVARIQQLEHERDELHKDIEQLCTQQAGPSYLVVATKMHFQRTAGLEQEIENLKKKLAACTRDNLNLQEELSEAYRIKNMEAEKQVKFFQGCVASAFAERDHAIMEAEKAKEKEELMSLKFNDIQKRLEELVSDCLEQKRLNNALVIDQAKHEEQNETFKKVVNKFYKIRHPSLEGFEDASWDDKCAWLLHDSTEMWSYNDNSTSKYIIHLGKMIMNGIGELRHHHSVDTVYIMNLLDEGRLHIQSTINMLEEKIGQIDVREEQNLGLSHRVVNLDINECQDVHITNDNDPDLVLKEIKDGSLDTLALKEGNTSEALAQALQEKVSCVNLCPAILLYLSVMEIGHGIQERNSLMDSGEKRLFTHERDGRLRNLLKKTYLRRWIGTMDFSGNEEEACLNIEGNFANRRSSSLDFARMKIENATLKERMESMEHLTSSIRRLRLALAKVKEPVACEDTVIGMSYTLGDIIYEAKLLKTALGVLYPLVGQPRQLIHQLVKVPTSQVIFMGTPAVRRWILCQLQDLRWWSS
ncbi:hypothetical protein GH714_031367 [Hevea brasiliensis]|uniref:Uncharacterized protein n=1 Tax=Hevea brasiliensis TaxID=3981 RepID=A0A6A6N5Z5_HEVBR|nr:hypothetical protein GH714_031367 [Hevea brasiliensis]